MADQQKPTLKEVKEALKRAGLNPVDYKHLPYKKLLHLAGYNTE